MKKLIKNLIEFLNPNSQRNIDSKIEFLKKIVIENNSYTYDLQYLESSIINASDERVKHALKLKLKSKLEEVYDDIEYIALKDNIDRAW